MNKSRISIVVIVIAVILALGIGFAAGRISKSKSKGGNTEYDSTAVTLNPGKTGEEAANGSNNGNEPAKTDVTQTPEPTQGTGDTQAGETTGAADPTQTTGTAGAADPTRAAEVSGVTDTEQGSEATQMPEPTQGAIATGTPEPTQTAEVTGTTEPTQAAEPTGTPEPTQTAETTKTPEPTKTAEPTLTAEPTKAPEPTKKAEPTVAPTPTDAVTKAETGTPYENHGRLSVKGTKLVDKNGEEYRLRGVSTHGIAWFPDYVNKQAFQTLRDDWGVNCIRLAMYTAEYNGYCSGGNKSDLKKLVNNGVKYATELGMYVIIDWHILSDSNPMTNKSEAINFFTEMSAKYADYGNVIFEICNEPNGGTSWSQIKSYAKEVIPVIRKNAPKAIIVVGTPTWSQEVDKAAADPITDYDNIIYTIHFYAATHKDDLRRRMQAAVKSGIALFCTEFGTCDASGNGGNDFTEAGKWIDAMEEAGVSYCIWNLSNKAETSALISSGCSKTSGWKESDLSASGKWYANLLRSKAAEGTISAGIGEGVKDNDPQNVNDDSDKNNSDGKDNKSEDKNTGNDGKTGNDNTGNDNSGNEGSSGNLEPITAEKGKISVTLSNTGSWNDGKKTYYQFTLNIRNNGSSAVENWKISLKLPGKYELSQSWNGTFELKDKKLTIKPVDYNSVVNADQSAEVGFIICGDELGGMPDIEF